MSMPRFLKTRASSLEMSSSSTGTTRGRTFEDRDLGAEAAEDGGELDADGAGADDDERLGHRVEREDLDVGEDGVVGPVAGEHAGVGAGGEHDVLRFDWSGFCPSAALTSTVWTPSLRRAGEAAVALEWR